MNTQIDYMYRDGANWKKDNTQIVSGELSEAQINEISACLYEGEKFIPSQVGLPEKRFNRWDDETDHVWFELQEISTTLAAPTVSLSAEHLLDNFRAAKDNWHDSEHYEELASSMEHYEPEEEEPQAEQEVKRGKIVRIDGQMYELRLPTGGHRSHGEWIPGEWDEIIDILDPPEPDPLTHPLNLGEGLFSLCQECGVLDSCMTRGGYSPEGGGTFSKSRFSRQLGYRPILIPLDEHTLQPDTEYMAGWKDGTLFEMGTLYAGEEAVTLPDKPVWPDGNTFDYRRKNRPKLELRDSSENPAEHIRWIKAGNFLVADRNLLVNISWNDLDKQGLVLGDNSPEHKRSLDDIIKTALDKEFEQAEIPESVKNRVWQGIQMSLNSLGDPGR